MGGYTEGFRVGTEAGSPLDGVFGVLKENFARKLAERKKEEDDNKALQRELLKLTKTKELETELMKATEEEKRKTKTIETETEMTGAGKLLGTMGMGGEKGGGLPEGVSLKAGPLTFTGKQTAEEKGAEKALEKSIEASEKAGTAIRRLALINRQFKKALPSGDRTPLEQRLYGKASVIGTKWGLIDNADLMALKKNIRPMAINLIRLFGEVGNLSQSEQQGAIDIVEQEGLTDKERIAQTKQFIEYALIGSNPKSIEYLLKQKDIQGILDSFNVDLELQGKAGGQITPEQAKAELERRRGKK